MPDRVFLSPLRFTSQGGSHDGKVVWRTILQEMLGGIDADAEEALADTIGLFWGHRGLSLTTLYFPQMPVRLASFGRESPGIVILRSMDGPMLIEQAHRQVGIDQADVIFASANKPISVTLPQGGRLDCALLPNHALGSGAAACATLSMQPIAHDCLSLQLLVTYAGYMLQQRHQTDDQADMMVNHFYQLLPVLVSAVGDSTPRFAGQDRFSSVAALIARRVSDSGFAIRDVADAQGVTVRAIQKMFHRNGTTFSQYLLERRLDAAREQLLLRDNAPTITQLALDHGFEDPAYFSRAFRKRYGQSPGQLKRSAKATGDFGLAVRS